MQDEKVGDEQRTEALTDALHACIQFIENELHWEGFRAEMLYCDDEPKKRASAENYRRLRNFLARPDIKPHVEAVARRVGQWPNK